MQVTPSNFTVAEYCRQMEGLDITVNREYQRSDKVWPPSARSYLIETILFSYPIPKLSLYLQTDIKSRKTKKEIVDGQQRSMAILSFFRDEFSISGKSSFAGKKLSQLSEDEQMTFFNYQLSVDLFVAATPSDIREVFRRMNSYTVPLNPAEIRYATHQGEFKWFIADLTKKYSQVFKDLGVFSERNLVRMSDSTLFTEIVMSIIEEGIFSSNDSKITKFYTNNDKNFIESTEMEDRIDISFSYILDWKEIHNSTLMKPYNIYSLILAITHHLHPVEKLQKIYPITKVTNFTKHNLIGNLTYLAYILEDPSNARQDFHRFIDACSSGTNRINQRGTRFEYMCSALNPVIHFQ